MSFVHSPKIITEGLVLALDAGNTKSYTSGSTTWYDKSGNANNGTLTNGPTFSSANGGSIVFDGVDDYISTNYTTSLNNFTVCVWFKQVGSVIGYQRLVDKNYSNGFWIGRNGTNPNSWGGGVYEASAPFGRFISLTDGQWHFIVSKREGTTHTIYGDGITNTISGTVSSSPLNTSNVLIGRSDQPGIDSMNGNIAVVSLYNRALSASEIQQNFNALRGRYGI